MSRLKRRWTTLDWTKSQDVLRAYDLPYRKSSKPRNIEFGDSDPSDYGGPGKNFIYDRGGSEIESLRTVEDELDLKLYAPKETHKHELVLYKFDASGWPTETDNNVDKTKIKVAEAIGLYPERYERDLDGNVINNRFIVLSGNWNNIRQPRNENYLPTQSQILEWTKDVMGFTRGPSPYREDNPNNPQGDRTYQKEIAVWDLGITDPTASEFNADNYKKNSNPTLESGRYLKGARIWINENGEMRDRADVVPSEKVLRQGQQWIYLRNLARECRLLTKEFFFPGKFVGMMIANGYSNGIGDLIQGIYGRRFYWTQGIRARIYQVKWWCGTMSSGMNISLRVNGTTFGTIVTSSNSTPQQASLSSNPILAKNDSSYIEIYNNSNISSGTHEDLVISFIIELLGDEL